MFFNIQPTQFDVRFRLFGFPVRVHPLFWLVMALLGDFAFRIGPVFLLIWVFCGFVSILTHELGHAFFIRKFGSQCEIILVAFGGLAAYRNPPRERWKRVVIALAGPGFGFALLGILVGSNYLFGWASPEADKKLLAIYLFLFVMNLFWNVLNLLPIWPLDGGRVCQELCGALRLRNPDATAFAISFITAGSIAVFSLLVFLKQVPQEVLEVLPIVPGLFMTIWFAFFAVQSYQMWQGARREGNLNFWESGRREF